MIIHYFQNGRSHSTITASAVCPLLTGLGNIGMTPPTSSNRHKQKFHANWLLASDFSQLLTYSIPLLSKAAISLHLPLLPSSNMQPCSSPHSSDMLHSSCALSFSSAGLVRCCRAPCVAFHDGWWRAGSCSSCLGLYSSEQLPYAFLDGLWKTSRASMLAWGRAGGKLLIWQSARVWTTWLCKSLALDSNNFFLHLPANQRNLDRVHCLTA